MSLSDTICAPCAPPTGAAGRGSDDFALSGRASAFGSPAGGAAGCGFATGWGAGFGASGSGSFAGSGSVTVITGSGGSGRVGA